MSPRDVIGGGRGLSSVGAFARRELNRSPDDWPTEGRNGRQKHSAPDGAGETTMIKVDHVVYIDGYTRTRSEHSEHFASEREFLAAGYKLPNKHASCNAPHVWGHPFQVYHRYDGGFSVEVRAGIPASVQQDYGDFALIHQSPPFQTFWEWLRKERPEKYEEGRQRNATFLAEEAADNERRRELTDRTQAHQEAVAAFEEEDYYVFRSQENLKALGKRPSSR